MRAVLVAIVSLAFVVASCSSAARPKLSDPLQGAGKSVDDPTGSSLVIEDVLDRTLDGRLVTSIVATAVVPDITVYDGPGDTNDVLHELVHPIPSGGPLVFLVEESAPEWLRVLLPTRPNGSFGWVRASDVELASHNYRIEVSLSDFDLKVYDGATLAFQTAVAVAANNAPTPGGRYYITELLTPEEPDTIYGDFAYGLSGFSETFQTFEGGPGQLGIHGTNDPDRIGSGVSSGCVRLANGDIASLVSFLPLGTPVEIIG